MVKYVCPSCGKNERISQRSLAVVEQVGKFVSTGYEGSSDYEHQATDSDEGSIVEVLSDLRATYLFRCFECDYEFNEAITDKEFKQRTKKRNKYINVN